MSSFELFTCKLTLHDFTCTSQLHNKCPNCKALMTLTAYLSQINKLLSYISEKDYKIKKSKHLKKGLHYSNSLHVKYYKAAPSQKKYTLRDMIILDTLRIND